MWSSVPAWQLAFGRVGLSNWFIVAYLGTHSFQLLIFRYDKVLRPDGVFRPTSNSSTRASSFAIRSSNSLTKARTAGVISASSSGGLVIDLMCEDDIIHVVLENPIYVQINLPQKTPPGA
jgi:hypothetical protein